MDTLEHPAPAAVRPRASVTRGPEPAYQAYLTLYLGYALLPVVAGADKFTHYLVDWTRYLAPAAVRLLGGRVDEFMRAVGVVEIAAGLLVAVKPRWGALVVCLWLLGIVGNLLRMPGYYDIALRDFGLALGAFSLWRLSREYGAR